MLICDYCIFVHESMDLVTICLASSITGVLMPYAKERAEEAEGVIHAIVKQYVMAR